MSVVSEERNDLLKRFRKQALIQVEDTLYSVESLSPNARNKRLFSVHSEAVERLNSTMNRHISGNAQIFETMIYKDQSRAELIKRFWNGLITQKEFLNLPPKIQQLEHEQAKKLGPTSRFTIERLYDGFINHIDEEAKTENTHFDEYREAANNFAIYLADVISEARRRYPAEVTKYFQDFENVRNAFDNLNKDKSGGDPYFVRVDRKIGGVLANELYLKDAEKVRRNPTKQVYYEMFVRVQNKGNNIIPDEIVAVDKIPENQWLPEKNRVVQGDSRSWQFLLKNVSDIVTKIPKMIDPIFMGWADQERKNEIMELTLKTYHGTYLFDSFDATDYDASTDPRNFELGLWIIWETCKRIGLNPDTLVDYWRVVDHYLHDATLTPWGAFERDSTPSGHNFTGPNGTITNLLRCYVQTKRLLKVSFQQLNAILRDNWDKGIALFSAVGDDAFQLRDKSCTADMIAEENNSDGYKSSDSGKVVLDEDYIHFLQFGYYYDGTRLLTGYYPVCRVVEHGLFQEKADQYDAETVSAQAVVQNINNARFNPLQDYLIDFFIEGDVKYRLGSRMGVLNLFKLASKGRSVAETVGREWDPSYQGMTWEQFGNVLQGTAKKIESRAGKFNT